MFDMVFYPALMDRVKEWSLNFLILFHWLGHHIDESFGHLLKLLLYNSTFLVNNLLSSWSMIDVWRLKYFSANILSFTNDEIRIIVFVIDWILVEDLDQVGWC